MEFSSSADREATIRLLVDLAIHPIPGCWDDQRAEAILRHQSSPAELRGLGIEEPLIRYLWPEE